MTASLKHFAFALWSVAAPASHVAAQGGFIPPASEELIATVLAKDKALFDAVFESCDIQVLAGLVADDFEFYHDKGGHAFNGGRDWVEAVEGMCERQRTGTDYRARRELDASSSRVYPMANYGALHTGLHRFYRRMDDGTEQLVEVALFSNLWKYENGSWKLTRVFSYDHRDARGTGRHIGPHIIQPRITAGERVGEYPQ